MVPLKSESRPLKRRHRTLVGSVVCATHDSDPVVDAVDLMEQQCAVLSLDRHPIIRPAAFSLFASSCLFRGREPAVLFGMAAVQKRAEHEKEQAQLFVPFKSHDTAKWPVAEQRRATLSNWWVSAPYPLCVNEELGFVEIETAEQHMVWLKIDLCLSKEDPERAYWLDQVVQARNRWQTECAACEARGE